MATPRRLIIDPSQSGVFHCISRCVRRAFLCGRDTASGQNYEHRRAWIRDRLHHLSKLFAIEVHAYAVMSNHLHLVVRTVPEAVEPWSDEQVARRWLQLFAGQRHVPPTASSSPPTKAEILAFCRDEDKLGVCWRRLADLSWFMRCLNEPIARRADHEDGCTGRFWEGRFKCQKLEDEGAILACMTYVDLNPIRAGMADTPETSDFTSGQERMAAFQARRLLDKAAMDAASEPAHPSPIHHSPTVYESWRPPIGESSRANNPESGATDQGPTMPSSSVRPAINEEEHVDSRTRSLPLLRTLNEEAYVELLAWTGRRIRESNRCGISPLPSHLGPVFEQLDLDRATWVENVDAYGGLFRRVAGKLQHLRNLAQATGQAWLHGRHGAERLYASAK